MKKMLSSMVAALIILSLVAPVSHTAVLADPDDFAGGDGSEGDPYRIVDWNHLNNVRDYLGGHFILMNDLDSDSDGYDDLAGPDAHSNQGWQPIGGSFTGTFNGRGYEIRDLAINRPSEDNVGLFRLSTNAFIDAVGVVDAQVSGWNRVGGLVGDNSGTVRYCYATGSVNGNENVGGLAGRSYGTVRDSYSTCSVTGDSYVGGLAGFAKWKVEDCYATGTVSGHHNVGGLAGKVDDGTVAANCCATGNVTGDYDVGGLIGYSRGAVTNCCATGNVTGDGAVGGLIGYSWGAVSNCYATGGVTGLSYIGGLTGENLYTISNSYSTGTVSGSYNFGGLVGYNIHTVSNCFWDKDTSGMATSSGGTVKTTAELMRLETYTDTDTVGLDEAWDMAAVAHGDIDPSSIWNIVDGRSYPFFGWLRMRFELKAGWNMVSVPRELPPGKNTVAEVFKGEIVAIYTWNPSPPGGGAYQELDEDDVLDCQRGYWVAVTENKMIAYLMTA